MENLDHVTSYLYQLAQCWKEGKGRQMAWLEVERQPRQLEGVHNK